MSAYIYGIKNNKNNLYYIGQTINKETRKFRHFSDLENNVHPNRHLQNSYNKNGKDSFEFVLLEEVEDYSAIKEREDFWIEKIGYYNIDKGRSGFTPVALRNMSEAQLGKISSRRLLTESQVLEFLSIEEFLGGFIRQFSRIYNTNRIVPKGILSGTTYQDISRKYNSMELDERFTIALKSVKKLKIEYGALTDKMAALIWYCYKNKQMDKKSISILFQKDIRTIDRILKNETLSNSYEIYSRLEEEFLEKLLVLVIDNIVPSPRT